MGKADAKGNPMTLPKREAEAAALAAIPQDAVERAAHVLSVTINEDLGDCLKLARSMLYVSGLSSSPSPSPD
jgi:hypothetical protein